jgi:hypothetical protein
MSGRSSNRSPGPKVEFEVRRILSVPEIRTLMLPCREWDITPALTRYLAAFNMLWRISVKCTLSSAIFVLLSEIFWFSEPQVKPVYSPVYFLKPLL